MYFFNVSLLCHRIVTILLYIIIISDEQKQLQLSFTDNELKFDVPTSESHSQLIVRALTDDVMLFV